MREFRFVTQCKKCSQVLDVATVTEEQLAATLESVEKRTDDMADTSCPGCGLIFRKGEENILIDVREL